MPNVVSIEDPAVTSTSLFTVIVIIRVPIAPRESVEVIVS